MTKRLLILLYIAALTCSLHAVGIGTWRLYPSYSSIEQVETSGSDVYVRANGNLYSYHVNDGSLQTYDKTTGLTSSNITDIAWVPSAKKLLIIYSDFLFDLLDASGNVTSMTALRDYSTNKSKTVTGVRVSGKYAYVITEVATMKIDVRDEYVVETYKTGTTVPDLPAETVKEQGPNGSLTYDASNHCYWGANADGKLTKYIKAEDGTFTAQTSGVAPNGPACKEHNYLKLYNGNLYSLRGRYEDIKGGDTNTPGDVQQYDIANDTWTRYDNSVASAANKSWVAHISLDIDPQDESHVMVASKSGLYDYRNGKLTTYYDMNTTADPILSVNNIPNYSIVTSVKYDPSGNLWIFNMGNTNVLCLTKNGEWKTYASTDVLDTAGMTRIYDTMWDSRGMLWFVNNQWQRMWMGFYDVKSNQFRLLKAPHNQDGNDVFTEGNTIFCITEDQDNNMWVGCTNGTYYIASSDATKMLGTNELDDITVVQPKVARNDGSGLADYLLSTVTVFDIAVDAANRKWFATNAGVYLISGNNNEQVYHFTAEDSPLPSDIVKSIAIDSKTGTVYIGTLEGLCSFQSDVTESYGELSNDNAYAFPNPVPPDYNGMITIMGLEDNAQVKITTPAGYVVHTGTVSGASYQWDGRDQTGQRVASGVYSVLVTDQYGDKGLVTRIAMVK